MFRIVRMLVAAGAVALGVTLGVAGTGPAGTGHVFAAGGGASQLVQFCQDNPGQYPYPGASQGACVSFITSGANSNAYAPGLCSWIASTYLGNGYGFVLVYYDFTTGNFGFLGPVSNQGQCVSAIAHNIGPNQLLVDAFYP